MPPQQNGAPAPLSAPRSCSLDLTQSRKRAGISLEQIAERTKISLRFLRAIEAEEFEKLPGGIFTTSYLRQYAAAIGYGETELLDHYDRKMNRVPSPKAPQRAPSSRGLLDRWLRVPAQAQQSN